MNFINLYPLSFGEYLDGVGKSGLRRLLQTAVTPEPFELAFHNELLENLRLYYFIGGMPEAIAQYKHDKDLNKVRTIQTEILAAYLMDISKHATKTEAIKITNIRQSLQLSLIRGFAFSKGSPGSIILNNSVPAPATGFQSLYEKSVTAKTAASEII